jgi:hypothetical protein
MASLIAGGRRGWLEAAWWISGALEATYTRSTTCDLRHKLSARKLTSHGERFSFLIAYLSDPSLQRRQQADDTDSRLVVLHHLGYCLSYFFSDHGGNLGNLFPRSNLYSFVFRYVFCHLQTTVVFINP